MNPLPSTSSSRQVFRSPWSNHLYVRLVALIRRQLRPWRDLEHRFIVRLARAQNLRVRKYLKSRPPRDVLLILPRCLKKTGCREDVQKSVAACLSCRQCPVGDVAELCRQHQVNALVAFRSQTAFELARRRQPDLIIATACHDRLIKALRSVPEVPALLVPLTGMDRMCVNATADLAWLEAQLAMVAPKSPQRLRAAIGS